MNWLYERPRSIIEMWNILCDAIYERQEFYGLRHRSGGAAPMPQKIYNLPFEKKNLPWSSMHRAIIILSGISLNPRCLGEFGLHSVGEMNLNDPWSDFFAEWGIDGYAFHRDPGGYNYHIDLPRIKHSYSESFHAVAKIINDIIRYPLPQSFRGIEKNHIYDFTTGNHIRGENGIQIEYEDGDVIVGAGFGTIASWRRGYANAESYDHRGSYTAGKYVDGSYDTEYKLPILYGKVPLKVKGRIRTNINTSHGEYLDDYEAILTLNCDTGITDDAIDFSQYDKIKNEIMGYSQYEDIFYDPQHKVRKQNVWISLSDANDATLFYKLTADNFGELPYKYLE